MRWSYKEYDEAPEWLIEMLLFKWAEEVKEKRREQKRQQRQSKMSK